MQQNDSLADGYRHPSLPVRLSPNGRLLRSATGRGGQWLRRQCRAPGPAASSRQHCDEKQASVRFLDVGGRQCDFAHPSSAPGLPRQPPHASKKPSKSIGRLA